MLFVFLNEGKNVLFVCSWFYGIHSIPTCRKKDVSVGGIIALLVIKVIIIFVCLSSIHGKHLQQGSQTRGPQCICAVREHPNN